MITGDHAATAIAIGRELGLRHPGLALTGVDIDRLDDEALARAVAAVPMDARPYYRWIENI